MTPPINFLVVCVFTVFVLEGQTTLPNWHLKSINLFMGMHLLSFCPFHSAFKAHLHPSSCCVYLCFCPATARCQSRFNSETEDFLICLWWGHGGAVYLSSPRQMPGVCTSSQYMLIAVWRVVNFLFLFWSSLWFIFHLLTVGCGCMSVWSCVNAVGMWRLTSRTTD